MQELKDTKDSISLGGDARYDSIGHNVKYGVYSIYLFSEAKTIDFLAYPCM